MNDDQGYAEYQASPEGVAQELGLWQEWVLVVCNRMKMAPPTGREWDTLMLGWHPGKAPLASADELKELRAATPNVGANRAAE